jgi:hypothetical protein
VASAEALEDSISSSLQRLTQLAILQLDAWSVHGSIEGGFGGFVLGPGFCSTLARLTGLEQFQVSNAEAAGSMSHASCSAEMEAVTVACMFAATECIHTIAKMT